MKYLMIFVYVTLGYSMYVLLIDSLWRVNMLIFMLNATPYTRTVILTVTSIPYFCLE